MTKRERFEKFLANEPVDRVPVAFFHHFTTEQEWLTGLTNEAAFEKNIEGHRTARAKFDPDVIKIMNDTLMIMPVDTSFVKTPADLRKIQPPMPGSAFFEKSKELTKRVVAIYEGSDAPIYITAFSPCIILRNSISGMDIGTEVAHSKLYSFLEEDPDSVMAALDIIADSVNALNKMLLTECGAEAVYLSGQRAEPFQHAAHLRLPRQEQQPGAVQGLRRARVQLGGACRGRRPGGRQKAVWRQARVRRLCAG